MIFCNNFTNQYHILSLVFLTPLFFQIGEPYKKQSVSIYIPLFALAPTLRDQDHQQAVSRRMVEFHTWSTDPWPLPISKTFILLSVQAQCAKIQTNILVFHFRNKKKGAKQY